MRRRIINSAAPALAGTIAAMAFAMGAIAHDAGRRSVEAQLSGGIAIAPAVFSGIPTRSEFGLEAATAYTELAAIAPEPVVPQPATSAYQPVIALVIDDVAVEEDLSRRALNLPVPVTIAILPYADMSVEFDAVARSLGHETLIHLPMQPAGDADPGPNALRTGQGADEVRETLSWAVTRVPGADGFNNHMGSALTVDAAAMDTLFTVAVDFDLYFLDSLTAPSSLAAQAAEANGITAASRDIFIDHDNDAASINAQLEAIERVAGARGAAIAIGHPRLATLDALETWIPQAQARGFRFVLLSEVVQPDTPVTLAASGEAPGFFGGAD